MSTRSLRWRGAQGDEVDETGVDFDQLDQAEVTGQEDGAADGAGPESRCENDDEEEKAESFSGDEEVVNQDLAPPSPGEALSDTASVHESGNYKVRMADVHVSFCRI
jgi:hypothetical protein